MPDYLNKTLNAWRNKQNLTKYELADRIGCSSDDTSLILKGEVMPPDSLLIKIAEITDISFDEIKSSCSKAYETYCKQYPGRKPVILLWKDPDTEKPILPVKTQDLEPPVIQEIKQPQSEIILEKEIAPEFKEEPEWINHWQEWRTKNNVSLLYLATQVIDQISESKLSRLFIGTGKSDSSLSEQQLEQLCNFAGIDTETGKRWFEEIWERAGKKFTVTKFARTQKRKGFEPEQKTEPDVQDNTDDLPEPAEKPEISETPELSMTDDERMSFLTSLYNSAAFKDNPAAYIRLCQNPDFTKVDLNDLYGTLDRKNFNKLMLLSGQKQIDLEKIKAEVAELYGVVSCDLYRALAVLYNLELPE